MQLVTTEQQQQKPGIVQEQIPVWLQYLIGAYPQQKPSAMTLAVMESQFSEIAADVMLQAVKSYVAECKFWPAVSELNIYVDKFKASQEQWSIPFHIWHKVWARKNWTLCPGPCEELTPDIENCPFCEDMNQ